MYGDPALPANFDHLPYANPDAPKGGTLINGESGTFDSLNPFIVKGKAPYGVKAHTFESLLGRSYDEPFTLYGLLAESVEMDANRSWVEFTLNADAKFSDGDPVMVEDVIWSMQTLAELGTPNYASTWNKIESVAQTGPRSVKFTLGVEDRELPLIIALRPILNKSDWDGVVFDESSLRVPVGSGPYVVDEFEAGKYISFKRNPDYWGKDLGFNKGRHNLDEIRYEYFSNSEARWQAFVAGETSVNVEWSAAKWEDQYSFPAVEDGRVVKSLVPHKRPTGMNGFVFNTRNPLFADLRVRDALLHAFDFEWYNNTFNKGVPLRVPSYFANSELGFTGAATGRELAFLEPYRDDIAPDALGDYKLPVTNGSGRDRSVSRKVRALLQEAGWSDEGGVLHDADGNTFDFEIMLTSRANEAVAGAFAEMLSRYGITATVRVVDSAQYYERRGKYDYDMLMNTWGLSLSPGTEQYFYWGQNSAHQEGTRNYMGADNPAIDAMIDKMLTSIAKEDFVAATRALDRILTTSRYVIPLSYTAKTRVAHDVRLKFPQTLPVYGFWTGFYPDVWWFEE